MIQTRASNAPWNVHNESESHADGPARPNINPSPDSSHLFSSAIGSGRIVDSKAKEDAALRTADVMLARNNVRTVVFEISVLTEKNNDVVAATRPA